MAPEKNDGIDGSNFLVDSEYWAMLIRTHGPSLKIFIAKRIRNDSDRDDVFQATWLALVRSVYRQEPPINYSAWLKSVSTRNICNIFRSRNARPTVSLDDVPANILGNSSGDPKLIMSDKEECEALLGAIERILNEVDQAVLFFREVDGLPYEAISELMGIPVGTLRTRVFRAKEAIRMHLHTLR